MNDIQTKSGAKEKNAPSISQMLKTIERQNEYIHSLNSIFTIYETVLFVNLKNFSFNVISATPEVKTFASMQQNILSVVKMFGQYQVKPEHRQFFYSFLDPLTVSDRLSGQKYITAEYDTLNIGWVKARLIPVEFDYQGNLNSLIFTTECVEEEHKQQEILRYTSVTDALTNLPNRSAGQKMAEEILAKGEPIVFVLFDCDRFKQINDTLSHLVGDKVLKDVANVLRTVFPDQTIFRLGGDEFIAILTGSMAEQIISMSNDIAITADASECSVFQNLQQQMSQINIPELEDTPLTLSGGAVIYKGGAATFNDLYRKSDKALQVSKFQRTGIVTITNL